MAEQNLRVKRGTTHKSPAPSVLIRGFVYAGIVAGFLVLVGLSKFFLGAKSSDFDAFWIPSDSMCHEALEGVAKFSSPLCGLHAMKSS